MKKLSILLLLCIIIVSCNHTEVKQEPVKIADLNPQFENYKTQFIENLWQIYPGWASSQGYHKYDSVLTIPDSMERYKELRFAKANLDSLKQYDALTLSDNNKTDYYIIENQLNSSIWSINNLKSYQWNPSEYNVSGAFADLLTGTYDKPDARLRNFYLKMRNINAYYQAAKYNIKNPTVEHTQLAIDQNLGGIAVFQDDLKDALAKSKLSKQEKDKMELLAKSAVAAIKDYAAWLKNLKNETPRSFRLGKELYAKKFEYDIQSGYSIDEI